MALLACAVALTPGWAATPGAAAPTATPAKSATTAIPAAVQLERAVGESRQHLALDRPEAVAAALEPLLKSPNVGAAPAEALLRAQAWELLATGQERCGRFDAAHTAHRQAVAAFTTAVGAQDRRTLDARRLLALSLRDVQREDEAERHFRQVLADRLRAQPVDAAAAATDHRLLVEHFLQPRWRLAEAESVLQQAIAWRRRVAGFREEQLAAEWVTLAGLQLEQGRPSDAESVLLRLLDRAQTDPGALPGSERLRAQVLLGRVQLRQGRLGVAEQTLRQALDEADRSDLSHREDEQQGARLHLAEALVAQQRLPEAEQLLTTERQRLAAQVRGEFHPRLWQVLRRLGLLLVERERGAEAEPLLRQLAAATARLRGPRHPDTFLAEADLAGALGYLQRYGEAQRRLMQALHNLAQALGVQSGPVSRLRRQLAQLYLEWGRFAEAAAAFRVDLQTVQARLGPRHPEVADAQSNLAEALRLQGRPADAAVLFRQALVVREAQHPPVPATVAELLDRLGQVYMEVDDLVRAEETLLRALVLRRQLARHRHDIAVVAVQGHLAGVWTLVGKLDQSEALLREAIASAEALGPTDPFRLPNLLASQAGNLRRKGDLAAARALVERALLLRQQGLGPEDGSTAIIETVLGRILTAMGQTQAAREQLTHAIAVFDRSDDMRESTFMARARLRLAEALHTEGRLAQARQEAGKALRLFERAYGPRHEDTAEARNLLISLGGAR
jgi:tetratricopeptide (TPR) repeat protein